MKEYQFKVDGVWLDVHARTPKEAVQIINSQLHLLDEPLQAPGLIQRVAIEVQRELTVDDIVVAYDLETGEAEPMTVKAKSAN